jgi:DNA-binding CsgD family transcriptional regulator
VSPLWVYSPNGIIGEALASYVKSLGFRVDPEPERAAAAVFDLTSYESPLPPPPPIPCLAMVRSADPEVIEAAMQLGYRDVHHPSHGRARFAKSLQVLVAEAGSPGGSEADGADEDAAVALTSRETQVLGLVMLGLSNKRIAARLGIAERTAKHHITSLMRKYRVRSRWELLAKIQALQPRLHEDRVSAETWGTGDGNGGEGII